MQRLIVTGANGAGKSYVAQALHARRPNVPLHSLDAMKLTSEWAQRSSPEIKARLTSAINSECWIIEGGPSMLGLALKRADAVLWLDPPFHKRAWRLFRRPLKHRGKTRPELPPGNKDRLVQQYRFGLKSLAKDRAFRQHIRAELASTDLPICRCSTQADIDRFMTIWAASASPT